MKKTLLFGITGIGLITLTLFASRIDGSNLNKEEEDAEEVESLWVAPDTSILVYDEQGELIRYGRQLIANTSSYFGPSGSIKAMANGLNCQSCHLNAGTKPFGNNYGSVASLYPKFRERSGMVESIEKKINDCFERSMNGKSIDSTSKEMRAMVTYMKWLGANVKKGAAAKGAGLVKLNYLDRAADTIKGKQVFILKCMTCHGKNGEGLIDKEQRKYIYPPLWGKHSYNNGAGIYRISKLAAFIKTNMPFGVTYDKPMLTDEEAWDVAAYVNSQPRPVKNFKSDWPDLATKPVDHPYGPYTDGFSEEEHKYGPFKKMMR